MAKDPVCGMEVDEKTAKYKSIQANNVYYFCSAACKTEFDKNQRNISAKTVQHVTQVITAAIVAPAVAAHPPEA